MYIVIAVGTFDHGGSECGVTLPKRVFTCKDIQEVAHVLSLVPELENDWQVWRMIGGGQTVLCHVTDPFDPARIKEVIARS